MLAENTPNPVREGKLRVLWILLSSLIGALGGLILAEVICYSLIEISLVPAFAIVFGVGFCLLGLALGWRIWISVPGIPKKIAFLFFALIVLSSGIACFFLQKDWFHGMTSGEKIPLYAALGMSFAFSLTFSFSELVAMAPCDRCCGTNLENNPIFGTPKQIFSLFATTLSMGAAFGLMFGLTDVEDDSFHADNFKTNAIISIPLGVAMGGIFGAVNQWWRTQPQEYEEISSARKDSLDDDKRF